ECQRCAGDPLVGELARLDWTIEVLDRRLGDIRREFAGLTERRRHAAARRAVIAAELQRRLAQPAGSTSVPARPAPAPAPTGFVAPDVVTPPAPAVSASAPSVPATSAHTASVQAASASAASVQAGGPVAPAAGG